MRERAGAEVARCVLRAAAVMHPHVTEVEAHPAFERLARRLMHRLAGPFALNRPFGGALHRGRRGSLVVAGIALDRARSFRLRLLFVS